MSEELDVKLPPCQSFESGNNLPEGVKDAVQPKGKKEVPDISINWDYCI